MKNIIKSTIMLVLWGFWQIGLSQKPITHILIDPLKFNKQAVNAGLQVQINKIPYLALYGNIAQESKNLTTLQFQAKAQSFEVRFFPFSQQQKCKLTGCEQNNFKKKSNSIDAPILRGVYLAPGILFEKIVFDSISQKIPETTSKTNMLTTKTHAFTVALGYQIQISALTLGVSYQIAFRKTAFEGNYGLLKDTDFANQMQPNRSHLVQVLRAEIGIHF